MLKLNNFNNFFKVVKVCLFLSLNKKNKDKHLKFKVFMFYNFYKVFNFLIFFYKLCFIYKTNLRNKSFFSILKNNTVLKSSLNFFINYEKKKLKNLFIFLYDSSIPAESPPMDDDHFIKGLLFSIGILLLRDAYRYYSSVKPCKNFVLRINTEMWYCRRCTQMFCGIDLVPPHELMSKDSMYEALLVDQYRNIHRLYFYPWINDFLCQNFILRHWENQAYFIGYLKKSPPEYDSVWVYKYLQEKDS